MDDLFGPIRNEKHMIFHNFENYFWNLRNIRHHTPGSFYMTRRAVVSRVIRVHKKHAVRIRPIQSAGLVHFGWIFELVIELYMICRYFSHIEYV